VRGDEGRPAHVVLAALELVVADDRIGRLTGVEHAEDLAPVLDRAIEVEDEEADVGEGTAGHMTSVAGWDRSKVHEPNNQPVG
jgi:hypothetical protein